MIADGATFDARWLPVTALRITEWGPWDTTRIAVYMHLLAEYPGYATDPILVTPLDETTFAIVNGRHRFVAHLAAGRHAMACVVVKEPQMVIGEPRRERS